jgi:hypothetical protein
MEQSRLASEVELVWQFLWQRKDGFFVEVGAYEPQIGSQTWFLEERDWRGILVEPQSRFYERLRQARPQSARIIRSRPAPYASG